MFPFTSLFRFVFGKTFFLHVSICAGASSATGNISIPGASSLDRSNVGICPAQCRMNPASCLLSQGVGLTRTSICIHLLELKRACKDWHFAIFGVDDHVLIWIFMVIFHAQGHPWLIQPCWLHKQPCTSFTPFCETVVNRPYPPLTFVGSVRSRNFWRACGSCLLCSCSNGSLRGSWSRTGLGMISA